MKTNNNVCAFCVDCANNGDCPTVEAGKTVRRCSSFEPIMEVERVEYADDGEMED